MVAAGSLAFFIYLSGRLATRDVALLYGDLDPQDSGQIVANLEQMDVPYRISSDGRQISVPADQVGRLRVAMAAEGLPSGGSIGYEIFDRSEGLGATNFVQNINHLRALEGELARTIRSIGQVKQARVHLVLPRRELFSRERQEPSASIVLTMNGRRSLDRQQVQAIQNLVAAAVPNLKPTKVAIVDNMGTLLASGGSDEDGLGSAVSTAQEMRVDYQARLVRTIEELVERTVGAGNVRAEITAEIDFDRITENSEVYDPDGQVVRSTQSVEETSNSLDGQSDAPVTVGNNLPDATLPGQGDGTTSQSRSERSEETVNYEISRTVKTFVREVGLVRRLSVAILINGSYVANADGDLVYQPRAAEELEQIATLVRSAVGYDEERGDTLEVVNLRFAGVETEFEEEIAGGFPSIELPGLMRIAEIAVLGIIGVLLLLFVVRPVLGRMLDSTFEGAGDGSGAGLLPDPTGARPALMPRIGTELAVAGAAGIAIAPGDALALGATPQTAAAAAKAKDTAEEIDQLIDLNKVEGRVRASSIKKIGEIIDKHPEEAVSIVRSWLHQGT